MGKDWKSCELGEIAILSHSEPLQWEKNGKVVNWAKLALPSHSESLWWEKIGKVVNQAKLAILSHSEPLEWEKNQNVTLTQNPTFSFPGGGWVHHPEPKCHLDLKSTFFISGERGYISQNQNVTLTPNPTFSFLVGGGGGIFSVYLTNWKCMYARKGRRVD